VARAIESCVVLGRGRLGEDIVRRLARTGAFRRVALIRVAASGAASRAASRAASSVGNEAEDQVDVFAGGAASRLAGLLSDLRATVIIDAAVSESPTTPYHPDLFDRERARTLAGALNRIHARGGKLRRVVVLSSTAIYGVVRDSPLLFEEVMTDRAGDVALQGRSDPWVEGLRAAESTLSDACTKNRVGVAFLRAAPVVGGPLMSPVAAWLAAPMVVRAAGWDPPVQVLAYSDLLEAIEMAALEPVRGPINIVGRDTASLSTVARAAGRAAVVLPGPVADRMVTRAFGAARLRGRCIADGRRARQLFGFAATCGPEEAVRERG
jgi:nucleoside-diphosphate-sugar epimerase